jgi:hypothetical protein
MGALGTYQPERVTGPSVFEQFWGPLISGVGSGATAAIAGSDKRLKENVEYIDDPIFEDRVGVKRIRFNWRDTGNLAHGVLAQDLQEVHPELVHESEDGYLAVNYSGVFSLMFG